ISLASFWMNNKREKEKHIPVFVINKVTKFPHHYSIQLKNVKNNYVVIKEVYSNTDNIKVSYKGVMDTVVDKKRSGEVTATQMYKGHAIDVIIVSRNEFNEQIFIEGIDFTGNEFKVCTPVINFENGRKITYLQDRFLEFIKK